MKYLPWFLFLLLAACASLPPPAERNAIAAALAADRGWQSMRIPAPPFDLQTYGPAQWQPQEGLTVYFEGDGLAWISSSQPSADPTPRDPMALRLALTQPEGNVVYLARPCQYGQAGVGPCTSSYWTGGRFSPEVAAAMDRAVDVLKRRYGAARLTLVGYSGGGAVAALVAARRNDVVRLVTVAGNLDHRTWTSLHRIDPLDASLNAADASDALRTLSQWHFVGGDDNVVPALVAEAYVRRFPDGRRPVIKVEAGFDHRCCWAEHWPRLWREAMGQP